MASNGIRYEIVIDAERVEQALLDAGENFPRYRRQWMIQSANLIRDEIIDRAPVGVAGFAGQGISHNISIDYNGDTTEAEIGPNDNVPYAKYVEDGTDPHYVPHGPDSSLAQWAEMKGLNVYAVAKGIEKRGTKAHPFVGPAFLAVRDRVQASFNEGVASYLARFAA